MEVASFEPGNCHTDIIGYYYRSTDPGAAPHSHSCPLVAVKDPFATILRGSRFWPLASITGRGGVEAGGVLPV